MAEKWQCPSKDVLLNWTDKCLQTKVKLSDAEREFVLSIQSQLAYKSFLSREQVKWLEDIYARKTK